MATTKSADKKPSAKQEAASAGPGPMEGLANEILLTVLHRALVRLGEPARVSEIVRETGDESIAPRLARYIMESNPRRFAAVDRRWDVTQRYLDKHAPVSRTLQEIVTLYGAPIPLNAVQSEMATIYGRAQEYYDDTVTRMLHDSRYFSPDDGKAFGLKSWLLDASAGRDADVMFYNYLTAESLAPFKTAAELDWEADPLQAARETIVMGDGEPVDNRIVQWYAWKALGDDFDPVDLYRQIYAESLEFIPLSDHRWIIAETVENAREVWAALTEQVAEFVEEAAAPEPTVEAPAKPLVVTSSDLEELRKFVAERDEQSVTLSQLLTDVLEVMPSNRTFETDSEMLASILKEDADNFVWVGTDRFRAPDTLPPYLGQIPDSLTFPTLPRFETADGEILDQQLADGAFDDSLIEEFLSSAAQDVGDQEDDRRTRWPAGVGSDSNSIRLVLKAHHKEIGTFPLAQIPRGFLPNEPDIVEITVVDDAGNSSEVYVDYNVQLIYGMFDLYANITADSGAVFHLEKTDKPSVYRFVHSNETDGSVFVSPHRLDELSEYRNEVESGPVSTYDITRRILDHYRKGCSYLTLLTEVNLIRRTPRRLLASVLSGYTAFHERANRWTFDPKKEPEGFDRRKSGYVLKR